MADPKITITAVDQTQAAFASVLQGFNRLKAAVESFRENFAKVGAALGAIGLSAATFAKFTNTIQTAIDTGDQLNKLSQKVGISVEALSELKFAAELSDVSLEQFQKGMRGLSEVLVKANDETSKEARLLADLGVSAKDPVGALRQIADAFQRLPDGVTKTATAAELFGAKVGQDLIPLLNGGSAAMDQAAQSARRLGLVFTGENAKASEEFNDNMKKLKTGAEALGIALTSKLVKGLAETTGELAKAKEEGRLWTGVLEQAAKAGLKLAESLPGVGLGAKGVNAVLEAQARASQEELARRTASGQIRGLPIGPQRPDDTEARAACTLSGGTWDAASRRCIPKQTGAKGLSVADLFAQAALKRAQAQDEAEREAERVADREDQERQDIENKAAIARLEREDAANEAADEVLKKNRELAQTYKDLIDPTARFVRQLEEIRQLAADGFLSPDQAREAEFAIQLQIDKVNELGEEVQKTKSFAEEMGLIFSSAFEDAIVEGKKFSDVLKGLGRDIARIIVRRSITEPLGKSISDAVKGSGGSAGGILDGLLDPVKEVFKTIGFPGFASGGSFTVGGAGGTDSQLVAFKATPGERVTVQTPGQGGGTSIHVTVQAIDTQTGMQFVARQARNIAAVVSAQINKGGRVSPITI